MFNTNITVLYLTWRTTFLYTNQHSKLLVMAHACNQICTRQLQEDQINPKHELESTFQQRMLISIRTSSLSFR